MGCSCWPGPLGVAVGVIGANLHSDWPEMAPLIVVHHGPAGSGGRGGDSNPDSGLGEVWMCHLPRPCPEAFYGPLRFQSSTLSLWLLK